MNLTGQHAAVPNYSGEDVLLQGSCEVTKELILEWCLKLTKVAAWCDFVHQQLPRAQAPAGSSLLSPYCPCMAAHMPVSSCCLSW